MDVVHEIGYPAIAKAQQLSAERLGVRDANRWDITRERHSGDDSDVGTEHTEGRRKKCQQLTNENVAAAMRSSLPPGHRPPTATAARRGVGDADGKRRDKPVSPLPPRHDRSAQRMLLVDITQVQTAVHRMTTKCDSRCCWSKNSVSGCSLDCTSTRSGVTDFKCKMYNRRFFCRCRGVTPELACVRTCVRVCSISYVAYKVWRVR